MQKSMLITGGAGFIGSNSAVYFGTRDWRITIADNLSRRGSNENLEWLRSMTEFSFERIDIRDKESVYSVLRGGEFNAVLHLAGQVAVTSSIADPHEDFEINARGTFNIVDGVRRHCADAVVLYASTNKVYGKMESQAVIERGGRYEYRDLPGGVDEGMPLEFHSPYGCSKGCGDQYVLDYARIFGIRAMSIRQSCIYGTRQLGVEDQGWVAWFTIAGVLDKAITICGDGKQVRDVLFIDDLLRAYDSLIEHADDVAGHAFNVGGGPANTLSLLELLDILTAHGVTPSRVSFDSWRPGDQRVFVCNISKAEQLLGWKPEVSPAAGIGRLVEWVRGSRELLGQLFR